MSRLRVYTANGGKIYYKQEKKNRTSGRNKVKYK